MNFISELRRRNVIRMAGLYLVGAWLITQVAGTILPMFDGPDWVARTVVVLLAIGFIPALIISWVFELTPEGLRREDDVAPVDPVDSTEPNTAQRMNRMIVLVLLLALGYFAVDRFVLLPHAQPAPEQVTATAVRPDGVTLASTNTPDAAKPVDPKSIAVLPFANMSGKPDEDYFSDGMTEEVLNVLAKVPQLQVVARTSVFQFKGKGGDVREIGQQLGVAHIVEGSVRRDGQQVRITAQLVRVADGFHVWSETYDRELKGVFALQDDVARNIGQALGKSLDVPTNAVRAAVDPLAYDEYLKGRALLRQRADVSQAILHFEAAVAKAPEFAAGWSSLSLAYDVVYWWGTLDRAQAIAALAKAADAAERSAALDPGSAASEHALANAARAQFRYSQAEPHYLRALQLDPSYPDAREDYAELLYLVGRVTDSARLCRELVSLDPYFPPGWMRMHNAAVQLDLASEVAEAQRHLRSIAPSNFLGRFGEVNYALAYSRRAEAYAALADLQIHYPEDGRLVQVLLPWALREAEVSADGLNAAFNQLRPGERPVYLIARQDMLAYNAYYENVGPAAQSYYFANLYRSKPNGQAMLRDPRVKAKLVEFGYVAYWREKGWPEGCRPLGESDFECGLDLTKAAQ